MGRGLDGFFSVIARVALCSFEGLPEVVSHHFPVAMARGRHLFPFRTEKLSPSAPMVLGPKGPGRVGRRRFFINARRSPARRSPRRRPGPRASPEGVPRERWEWIHCAWVRLREGRGREPRAQ